MIAILFFSLFLLSQIAPKDIISSIKSEMGGDLRHGMLSIGELGCLKHFFFNVRLYTLRLRRGFLTFI